MATLTPQPTEWIADAPVRIERPVTIAAPAAVVWSHLADNQGWPEWFPGLRACNWTSSAPHGEGSQRFVHLDQFKVSERIIAWEPNRRWGMTVLEINAPVLVAMAEEALLSEVDGVTTLDFAIGIELTRLGRLLQRPLVGKQAKALETGLENLRARCVERAHA